MSVPNFVRAAASIALICVLAGCATVRMKSDVPVARGPNPMNHHGEQAANDILFRAIGLVGTPYRYGGNTPAGGFDCSGLVDYVFRDVAGVSLPRSSEDMGRVEGATISRDRLASGDLVFFNHHGRAIAHVGIYVGEGRFVHAPNEGGTVRLDDLDGPYWRDHFIGAKRIPL